MSYFLTLIVSFLLLLISSLTVPFYFETGNDVFSKLIASGTFTGVPEGVISSYGSAVLLSDLYAALYRCVPNVPWFDLFNLLFNSVVVAHAWILLKPIWAQKQIGLSLLVIAIILLLGQNIILSEPTRIGILLSGTSLMLLFTNSKPDTVLKVIIQLFVIIGFLIRIEAGILAFVLLQMIGFLYAPCRKSFILQNLPLYFAVSLLLIFINIPRNDAEERYLSIRPYQFSLWDFYPEHEHLNLENYSDSVKLLTSKQFFLADEQGLSDDFFERIGIVAVDKTPVYLLNYFQNPVVQKNKFLNYAEVYLEDFLLFIILWLTVFITTVVFSRNKIKCIIIFLLGLSSLIALAFFMKMEERLFYPLICLNILALITFNLVDVFKSKISLWMSILYSFIFLISVIQVVKRTSLFYKEKSIVVKELSAIKDKLKAVPDSSIVLINLTTLVHWDGRYFEKTLFSNSLRLIPYDNGLMFSQEGTRKLMQKYFDCHEFECVSKASLRYENTYFISDSSRLALMERYLSAVYSIDFDVEKINTHPMYRATTNQSFELYQVKGSD